MTTIRVRGGAEAGIPTLADREPAFTTDTHKLYVGMGGTNYQIGGGTVTSVDLAAPAAGITVSGGPITASGSITLALADDLAAIEAVTGTDTLYYRSGVSTWTAVTIGSGLSFSGGTLSASGGAGTVTSVGLSLPSIFSVSGSPVTTSGTLAGSLANQSANKIWAGPSSGGAAAPTFRDQVVADLPALVWGGSPDPSLGDLVAGYDGSGFANASFDVPYLLALARITPGGRLTLSSGTPVTTSDVTGATTLYYTPYVHDMVYMWDGTRWVINSFSELSLSLGTMTADLPYDIFLYSSSGNPALEKLAWASATARATDVTFQDGRLCKNGDKTRLLLGTICPYSTTQVRVNSSSCRVWNMYNRRLRPLFAGETTDSWTYTTATWREINAGSTVGTSRVEYVVGYSDRATHAVHHHHRGNATAVGACCGIGISSSSVNSAQATSGSAQTIAVSQDATYLGFLPIGFGTLRALEISQASGTTTWYGDAGLSYFSTGLVVDFYA